ncbi:MAG: hypothetical protein AB1424_02930 [Thermodesulfobacteriota bacterium]
MSKGWSFFLGLIAILSISGLAWSQLGNTLKEETQKQFLQPYSPVKDYQNLNAADQTIDNNTNRYKNIGRTPHKVVVTTPKKSAKSLFQKRLTSEIPRATLHTGTAGSSPSFQGYNQVNGSRSGSFLDGYLLRSLQEKRKVRTEAADDSKSNEDQLIKKKKDLFFK